MYGYTFVCAWCGRVARAWCGRVARTHLSRCPLLSRVSDLLRSRPVYRDVVRGCERVGFEYETRVYSLSPKNVHQPWPLAT